jgi:hypothetical protein
LARDPTGSICAFWAAEGPSGGAQKLYSRCFTGRDSTEATLIQDQWRDADPAFTPDGTPQTIWSNNTLYFDETELVSDNGGLVYQPTFTIDTAGNYHAVWVRQIQPFRLEYFSSGDGGQTWSEIEQLTGAEATNPGWPQLVADEQGNVHLAWIEFGGRNFYRRWTPGEGWGEAIEIGPDTPGSAWFDMVIDPGGLAHMVWIPNEGNIYYAQQQSDSSWNQPQLLVEDARAGEPPTMAIDAQGVRHFVWPGSDQELYYATLPAE